VIPLDWVMDAEGYCCCAFEVDAADKFLLVDLSGDRLRAALEIEGWLV